MKYIRIFFTFLGYLTFTALIGGATFWYIGYHKAQRQEVSTVRLREISMTPEKQPDTTTVSVSVQTLPDPPQVYDTRPRKAKQKSAPVSAPIATVRPAAQKAQPVKAETKSVTYTSSAKPATTAKKTTVARAVKSKAKHSPTAPNADLGLPAESSLAFRVTDNGANPRTGRGIVNIYETTDLERQVARRLEDLQQLKEAAEQIRNPPVHESGIMKLLSGNK